MNLQFLCFYMWILLVILVMYLISASCNSGLYSFVEHCPFMHALLLERILCIYFLLQIR